MCSCSGLPCHICLEDSHLKSLQSHEAPLQHSSTSQITSLFQNTQYYGSFTETNLTSDLWHPPSSSTPITEVASRGHLLLPADSDNGMGSWTERKCTGINH